MNSPRVLTRTQIDAAATGVADTPATALHEALTSHQAQLAGLQATVDDLRGQPDAEVTGREVAEQGVQTTLETIREVEAALHRIELGTYGTCERCGEAIPPERLEVVPYAARCVRCPAAPRLIG